MADEADVLIVDDDPDVGRTVCAMLETLGLKPHCVSGAKEAREWLSSRTPRLIVADIMMPDENGLDFLQWSRSKPELRSTAFIVLSGLSDEETIQDALDLGAADYIKKPTSLETLRTKLRRFLSR